MTLAAHNVWNAIACVCIHVSFLLQEVALDSLFLVSFKKIAKSTLGYFCYC